MPIVIIIQLLLHLNAWRAPTFIFLSAAGVCDSLVFARNCCARTVTELRGRGLDMLGSVVQRSPNEEATTQLQIAKHRHILSVNGQVYVCPTNWLSMTLELQLLAILLGVSSTVSCSPCLCPDWALVHWDSWHCGGVQSPFVFVIANPICYVQVMDKGTYRTLGFGCGLWSPDGLFELVSFCYNHCFSKWLCFFFGKQAC